MPVLDRFIGELQTLRSRVAEESLTNVVLQDGCAAAAYGRAVGRLEGLRLAEETLNKLLNEPEDTESGAGRRSRKT